MDTAQDKETQDKAFYVSFGPPSLELWGSSNVPRHLGCGFNKLRPEQNWHNFAEDIFKCNFQKHIFLQFESDFA